MEKTIELNSIARFNSLYGLKTLHPLINVVDMSEATHTVNNVRLDYGLYALFLKQQKSCDLLYGRRTYDYQEGTIVCFAPGQSVTVTNVAPAARPALGLVFHPDLLRGTPLEKDIRRYTYFSYEANEALHLSEEERDTVTECFRQLRMELSHEADKHSYSIITMRLNLLLNYCMRFYERQFVTRRQEGNATLSRFGELLESYLNSSLPEQQGLPTVKYFADKVCLSPNYFGDMVKKLSGKTAQEFIQERLMDFAKERIRTTDDTVSQIAYSLGFQYPQHFSRLFKRLAGCTPGEYRQAVG